ncbi:MAG: Pyruvate kinase [Parcubacteria group bacterium GW2011_GWC2_45_7]|nr:MAG: Pyruvate kinase [Parcubacteria group bacterium GW2011_GWC2_45_7]KKU74148.1 MAG: Pyruvate kinase [Parcubacteria group bacterium GW2011_GWA2_47_26]
MERKPAIIVTLGPATRSREALQKLKDQGVSFVRVNMSHSSLEDLENFIDLAKDVGIPFVLDTEGSQIRSGNVQGEKIEIEEGGTVRLCADEVTSGGDALALRPFPIVFQLELGDILHLDFGTLVLQVTDVSKRDSGCVLATAISAGALGSNKGVIVDPSSHRRWNLPCLTEKDYRGIEIGLQKGVSTIAASFMRSRAFVEEVRRATQGRMKIISKIECVDALHNLDEIIKASDYLLIDRGDLSKEVPIEKVPLLQKIIISAAREHGKEVFVATNLLETMVDKPKPTRAEVHDIVSCILDGAGGLALAAETAIGKYPFDCVQTLQKIISHVGNAVPEPILNTRDQDLVAHLKMNEYLTISSYGTLLVPPHGGVLVDRMLKTIPNTDFSALSRIQLDELAQMDVEQIGIGTFSPLQGFMTRGEVESVLNTMRLPSGVIWPIPVILDVNQEQAKNLKIGQTIGLYADRQDLPMAFLRLEDIFTIDKEFFAEKLYGTLSNDHPGVRRVKNMKPVLLGGTIDLLSRRETSTKAYELTPAQTRRLFAERGWRKVVGFHTRNVIHRSHEYIQLKALEDNFCDGLFVHPVIGKKKAGDFQASYIIRGYELMMQHFYPKNKVIFGTLATFSRYAGPREALFTAICRKNFGCSHFIVGRDHTGVGDFYAPTASHEIFDRFPDLGITPIRFGQIFYSENLGSHMHEWEAMAHPPEDRLQISGTQARKLFESGELPPEWFIRPEIAQMIKKAIEQGEEVFVKE